MNRVKGTRAKLLEADTLSSPEPDSEDFTEDKITQDDQRSIPKPSKSDSQPEADFISDKSNTDPNSNLSKPEAHSNPVRDSSPIEGSTTAVKSTNCTPENDPNALENFKVDWEEPGTDSETGSDSEAEEAPLKNTEKEPSSELAKEEINVHKTEVKNLSEIAKSESNMGQANKGHLEPAESNDKPSVRVTTKI